MLWLFYHNKKTQKEISTMCVAHSHLSNTCIYIYLCTHVYLFLNIYKTRKNLVTVAAFCEKNKWKGDTFGYYLPCHWVLFIYLDLYWNMIIWKLTKQQHKIIMKFYLRVFIILVQLIVCVVLISKGYTLSMPVWTLFTFWFFWNKISKMLFQNKSENTQEVKEQKFKIYSYYLATNA